MRYVARWPQPNRATGRETKHSRECHKTFSKPTSITENAINYQFNTENSTCNHTRVLEFCYFLACHSPEVCRILSELFQR